MCIHFVYEYICLKTKKEEAFFSDKYLCLKF